MLTCNILCTIEYGIECLASLVNHYNHIYPKSSLAMRQQIFSTGRIQFISSAPALLHQSIFFTGQDFPFDNPGCLQYFKPNQLFDCMRELVHIINWGYPDQELTMVMDDSSRPVIFGKAKNGPTYTILFSNDWSNNEKDKHFIPTRTIPSGMERIDDIQLTFSDTLIQTIVPSDHVDLTTPSLTPCRIATEYKIRALEHARKECEEYDPTISFNVRPEIQVKYFLQSKNIVAIRDWKIIGSPWKYRIDFLIFSGSLAIILEVDENQHKRYFREREQDRMIAICADVRIGLGYAEVLVIRFNPDRYRSKYRMYEMSERLHYLYEILRLFIDNSSRSIGMKAGVIYLYYDDFKRPYKITQLY